MSKLNDLINKGIFSSSDISKLNKNSLANLFDVVNKGEKSYYNLCKNIYFNNNEYLTSDMISFYTIVEDDSWTNISYKFYRTYELWWLICKFNNVKNPFYELIPGNQLLIPSKEMVEEILNVIKNN